MQVCVVGWLVSDWNVECLRGYGVEYWNVSRCICDTAVQCKPVWSICSFIILLLCWKNWIKYFSSTFTYLLFYANCNNVIVVSMSVHSCVLLRMWLAYADWGIVRCDVANVLFIFEFYIHPVCPMYECLYMWQHYI